MDERINAVRRYSNILTAIIILNNYSKYIVICFFVDFYNTSRRACDVTVSDWTDRGGCVYMGEVKN